MPLVHYVFNSFEKIECLHLLFLPLLSKGFKPLKHNFDFQPTTALPHAYDSFTTAEAYGPIFVVIFQDIPTIQFLIKVQSLFKWIACHHSEFLLTLDLSFQYLTQSPHCLFVYEVLLLTHIL